MARSDRTPPRCSIPTRTIPKIPGYHNTTQPSSPRWQKSGSMPGSRWDFTPSATKACRWHVTPFRGLYAAVTRKSEDGKREYFPEQKLTIEQAIAAYTTGSAFAEFSEKDKGTLAGGNLADFVVLDRDITAAPAEKVLSTKVL